MIKLFKNKIFILTFLLLAVFGFTKNALAFTVSAGTPTTNSVAISGTGYVAGIAYSIKITNFYTGVDFENRSVLANASGYLIAAFSPLSSDTKYKVTVSDQTTNAVLAGENPEVTFKTELGNPTLTISASPTTIHLGEISKITWSSTNLLANSCAKGGGWSGTNQPFYGSQNVTPTATATYTITCTGPNGPITGTTTITIDNSTTITQGNDIYKGWYYMTTAEDAPTRFENTSAGKTDCENHRKSAIQSALIGRKNYKISQCKNFTTGLVPTEAQMEPFEAITSPTDIWWYEVTNNKNFYLRGPFDSAEKCKKETDTEATPLSKVCFMQKTVPDETATGTVQIVNNQHTSSDPKEILNYYPLAPITGVGQDNCDPNIDKSKNCINTGGPDGSNGFASYFNAMIKVIIGISAVLAMIMIVAGGIEYMTSGSASGSEEGKKRIMGAITGLIIALGSYAILNTINSQLLDVSLSGVPTASVIGGLTEIGGTNGGAPNGNCNPTVSNPGIPEILAQANGAQGASCFGGAMKALTLAGYALGAQQNGSNCPTSVAPGDVLQIHNGNNAVATGDHNVIFDSKSSNGSWKVWSQAGAPDPKDSTKNRMRAITYSVSDMSKQLKWSWKPLKCPKGAHMLPNNNDAECIK